MVAGTDWTAKECDALIRFYFDLYERHLNGEQFNKRALIQGLMSSQLPGRSRGAVEYKMQNVSYVLVQRGLPYLPGYVPAAHKQELLRQRVDAFLGAGSHPSNR